MTVLAGQPGPDILHRVVADSLAVTGLILRPNSTLRFSLTKLSTRALPATHSCPSLRGGKTRVGDTSNNDAIPVAWTFMSEILTKHGRIIELLSMYNTIRFDHVSWPCDGHECPSYVRSFRLSRCSYFCDSCDFLWPALFGSVLFASQGFSGHKEAQNSQEELWNQPRIDYCDPRNSRSRFQTTYGTGGTRFFVSFANSERQ